MSDANMKEAALWYVRNGIPVVPLHWPHADGCSCGKNPGAVPDEDACTSPGKHPHTRRGFKDATTDPAQIANWWGQWPNANIGIPTGAASGFLVVDCDPRNGGPRDRCELIERLGPIPETAEVITGGGGRHFYFRHSGGTLPKTLGVGIDLKGDGGYVVAPPSLHASGNQYEVDGIDDARAFLNVAEAPEWLKSWVAPERNGDPLENPVDREKWGTGQRNNMLTSVAGSMRRRGLSHDAIEAALLAENLHRCDPPLPEAEVRRISNSIARYRPAPAQDANEWPELIPFGRCTPDLIPASCLPGWLGDMAVAVAENTETPLALSALLSIAVVASTGAGKVEVSPEPGCTEPLNVFTCPAMESGNRKTAVFGHMLAPFVEWEDAAVQRTKPERDRLQSQRRTMEKRIEGLRNKAASADDAPALIRQIQELEADLPTVPVLLRLFCQDITPERLASLMQEQGEKMAVFSDEGGVFDMIAGRYSRGVPNLDIWLQGYARAPATVDRQDKDKPPIRMIRPTLTAGICPQPDVLASLKDKPGFRGRGFLARVLYALPPSQLGYRVLSSRPVPEQIEMEYRNGIWRLLEYRPEQPVRLTLSASAYQVWKTFQRAIEQQFRDGGLL